MKKVTNVEYKKGEVLQRTTLNGTFNQSQLQMALLQKGIGMSQVVRTNVVQMTG